MYGIFGLPHGLSGKAVKQSIGNRIHLGLDLSGGTHLVLQVMVSEAVGAVTDNDVARLETDFQQAGIQGATIGKTDPSQVNVIHITGTSADKSSTIRDLLDTKYGATYNVSSGSDGSYTLTMKTDRSRDD